MTAVFHVVLIIVKEQELSVRLTNFSQHQQKDEVIQSYRYLMITMLIQIDCEVT